MDISTWEHKHSRESSDWQYNESSRPHPGRLSFAAQPTFRRSLLFKDTICAGFQCLGPIFAVQPWALQGFLTRRRSYTGRMSTGQTPSDSEAASHSLQILLPDSPDIFLLSASWEELHISLVSKPSDYQKQPLGNPYCCALIQALQVDCTASRFFTES